MSKKFSISKQLWNQHFVYTSDRLLLLVFTGMDISVDGSLDIGVSYDGLNGLYRGSCIVQQRCVRMPEDVGRSPVEVDGATNTD